ncbi:MAG: hypothetical protein U0230_20575 [Polyangiales bacterium]
MRVRCRPPARLRLVLSLVVALASGCDDESRSKPRPSPLASDACLVLASTRCAAFAHCADAFPLERRFRSREVCVERLALECAVFERAPGTAIDAAWTSACAAAHRSVSCDVLLHADVIPGCEPPRGTLADGAPCVVDAQCAGGRCGFDAGGTCGSCGSPGGLGASCATIPCATGFACNEHVVCAVPALEGEPCGRSVPCAKGTSCVGASHVAMGVCVADARTPGATCDPAYATGGGCDEALGLGCDPVSSTCVVVTVREPIEACNLGDPTVICGEGSECLGTATGTACAVVPSEGDACDRYGVPCLEPSVCRVAAGSVQGVCLLPDDSLDCP